MSDVSKKYHFVGIGGVGMSALAHIMLQKGYEVSGSDREDGKRLTELRESGATVFCSHEGTNVSRNAIVIYSTAICDKNPELLEAKELGCTCLHRSDLLQQLLCEKKALVVSGSHGKTTVSCLLAYTLQHCGLLPSYIIGGFSDSLRQNGCFGSGDYFVAEGDESDGSFLKTEPFGSIVTNIDFDHIGYYWEGKEELLAGFQKFIGQVKNHRHLFFCGDDSYLKGWGLKGKSFGFGERNDVRATNVSLESSQTVFDITFNGETYDDIIINMLGKHNVLNALGVFGLALSLGADPEEIRNAFSCFGGTIRRLEWKGEECGVTVYSDYAHHPTEISAVMETFDEIASDKKVWYVFQPHRYTRTNELQGEFSKLFSGRKNYILTDIDPAGEDPIADVSTQSLMGLVKDDAGIEYIPKETLVEGIVERVESGDLVVVMGAGIDIGDELISCIGSVVRK